MALAVLPYVHTLGGPLIWDDVLLITENAAIHQLHRATHLFSLTHWVQENPGTPGQYRPLRSALFAVGFSLWGDGALGYRITNLALYVLTVWMVYAMGRRLLPDGTGAFLAAAAFALHPAHTEAVAWVKNHTEVMACLFVLLGLWGFQRGMEGSRAGYALSVALFPLAMLSKETAVVYPLLLGAWMLLREPRAMWVRGLIRVVPHGLLLLAYGGFLFLILGTRIDPIQAPDLSPAEHLGVVLKSFWYYVKDLFFPLELNVEPQIRTADHFSALLPWAGGGVLAATGWLWHRLRRTHPPAALGLTWMALALLPVLNIKYITGRPLADQRVFLASVGACWLLGYGASRLLKAGCAGIPAAQYRAGAWTSVLVVLGTASALTWDRNFVWTDPMLLYEDTIRKSPMAERAHYNLGNTYKERGEWEKAAEAYRRAIAVNPSYEGSHNNLGLVYFHLGQYDKAEQEYLIALRIKPQSIRPRMNLGVLHMVLGRPLLAQEEFQRVLAADPGAVEAHLRLGQIHADMERWDQAEAALLRARELDPRSGMVEMQLARVRLHTRKQRDEVIQEVQEALRKDPENHEALVLMGNLLAERGQVQAAMESYDRALALEPGNPYVLVQKGLVLERLGHDAEARKAYRGALGLDPHDPFANLRWGALLLREGKASEAAPYLRRALAVNPQDPEVHLQVARLLLEGEETVPQAILHLKRVLSLSPQHPRRGEIQGIIDSLEVPGAPPSPAGGSGR
jgi:tetratricopeptide (TPR) repeat protein